MTELDPRLTFENFVVGPANRLASAAARRAADAPGASYNPLFIYSAPGLGKSHILMAIAHKATRDHPERQVLYQTLEVFLSELTEALAEGQRESMRKRYQKLHLLLLDDVQFLTGQPGAQEMVLGTLDSLTASRRQIVLASDRPPVEIDGLDARLLSRFSAGLIVDMGVPEYETRVAIVQRYLEQRGAAIQDGVARAVARIPFKNVRELQGGLNQILAIQDLEDRSLTPDEARAVLERDVRPLAAAAAGGLPGLLGGMGETQVEEAPWRRRLREIARMAESWGFIGTRLERYADTEEPPEPEELNRVVQAFKRDIQRLRDVRAELDRVGNPWPEAATALLQDPERLEEAESLLASAKERQRPFPRIADGPLLGSLASETTSLAVRAAERLVLSEPPEYNPLYLACSDEEEGVQVLEAAGRTYLDARAEGRVGLTSATEFAEDFIRALAEGVAGAWRERWWTVELLLLYGVQELSETERAQEELFHLFEALKRRGARIFLASDRLPSAIEGIEDRLRSRFEGGLVVEVERGSVGARRQEARRRHRPEDAEAEDSGLGPVSLPPLKPLDWGEFQDDELFSQDDLVGDARAPVATSRSLSSSEVLPPLDIAPRRSRDVEKSIPPMAGDKEEAPAAAVAVPSSRGNGTPSGPAGGEAPARPRRSALPAAVRDWYPSPEQVVWDWPVIEERLAEDID
jgi:chromosomal replication initiation ATPase DnaA